MTVKDLIEQLELRDPNKPIIIDMAGIQPTTIKEIINFDDAVVLECEEPR